MLVGERERERERNIFSRLKLATKTNHDYKYGCIYVIHMKIIKNLHFLTIHDNDLNACGGITLGMVCKHEVPIKYVWLE